jgi:hypothetical protein
MTLRQRIARHDVPAFLSLKTLSGTSTCTRPLALRWIEKSPARNITATLHAHLARYEHVQIHIATGSGVLFPYSTSGADWLDCANTHRRPPHRTLPAELSRCRIPNAGKDNLN